MSVSGLILRSGVGGGATVTRIILRGLNVNPPPPAVEGFVEGASGVTSTVSGSARATGLVATQGTVTGRVERG